MIDIKQALEQATEQLNSSSDTARLDAELLLMHALACSRVFLYAHSEDHLSPVQEQQYQQLLSRRIQGTPLAYLTGTREFWSMPLRVTKDTLIPRPETELLVELALKLITLPPNLSSPRRRGPMAEPPPQQALEIDPRLHGDDSRKTTILDLGTGSGTIALALASERPAWEILACDKSPAAIKVARDNASHFKLTNLQFICSDWFESIPTQQFNAIVSNPPYIAAQDPHLSQGDLRFEPQDALVSGTDGLDALRHIIEQASVRLIPGGWLLLEHGFNQGEAVINLLKRFGYQDIQCWQDWQGHDRVSSGRKNK